MRMRKPLELWGGIESTIARVGDRFRDQVAETGHRDRPEDLDRIAALGIRTLRYPVLWEAIAPDRPDECRWDWHDERLERLRSLGIRPIAGLIHHGSGPTYTNLLDPDFPTLFAGHAARVAERYPWLELYTPVNEPLTTARFSALYGHWYPHQRTYSAFLRALVNQCLATVHAMRAIRRVNPSAKLVQTDDFGKTFSTPPLAYQADHDNERRWLSFDLLFGRVNRDNGWWPFLIENGVPERDLEELAKGECPPDIVGINHYLTSERFLDDRLRRYPQHFWGGNAYQRFADVEAVRVRGLEAEVGPAARLREVWARYRAPIAVTEVHHGCTRDEQLRWLHEVWEAAETVRDEGADIRAVTVWSLLGTVDWNSLLTREAGVYEPGAFDARANPPRLTALGAAARALATEARLEHPVLATPGWWRRESRFYRQRKNSDGTITSGPPLLVLAEPGGAAAEAVARVAAVRGLHHCIVPSMKAAASLGERDKYAPWAVLDLRGLAPRWAARFQDEAALAELCRSAGATLASLSSAAVFDGSAGRPGLESDVPQPLDLAAKQALLREARLRGLCPEALIIRTGPVFGPWDRENAVFRALADLASGSTAPPRPDLISPTYLPDLLHIALDLVIDRDTGLRHLTNPGPVTWEDLLSGLAARAGLAAPPRSTRRGRSLALATEREPLLPPLASALDRFVADCEFDWRLPEGGVAAAAE